MFTVSFERFHSVVRLKFTALLYGSTKALH